MRVSAPSPPRRMSLPSPPDERVVEVVAGDAVVEVVADAVERGRDVDQRQVLDCGQATDASERLTVDVAVSIPPASETASAPFSST